MRIAFAIVSLFPGGGLQRDCIEIAKSVRNLGHDVVIYTCRLKSNAAAGDLPIQVLENDAFTNHARQYRFAVDFLKETSNRFDLIVGFDKLLGLDVLYCADASVGYRMSKNPLLHFLRRYRTFANIEKESFAPNRKTTMILLSHDQIGQYRSAWGTELTRMILVPPTLTPSRRQPDYRTNGVREALRSELNLKPDDWVWVSIGVQPKTKGLDRIIDALAQFPSAKLLVCGLNESDRIVAEFVQRSRKRGVTERIKWLGHREDIPRVAAAADLLVHPARYDTTGTVILEALVNGLPVITTAASGYARHVDAAGAGIVVREPYDFRLFVAALQEAQNSTISSSWSAAAVAYGDNPSLYQGRLHAAQIIVKSAQMRLHGFSSKNWAEFDADQWDHSSETRSALDQDAQAAGKVIRLPGVRDRLPR